MSSKSAATNGPWVFLYLSISSYSLCAICISFHRLSSFQAGVNPPEGMSLDVVRHFLTKMQKAYSPLKKLENLLSATSAIYQTVSDLHSIL